MESTDLVWILVVRFVPLYEHMHNIHNLFCGEEFFVLEGNRLEWHPCQPCVRAG